MPSEEGIRLAKISDLLLDKGIFATLKDKDNYELMEKELIVQFKKALEKEKRVIEKELKSFAKKDIKLKGDYDTRFPNFGIHQSQDEAAQEIVSYENILPVEYTLELKLKDIEVALEKIKKGKYGICEKCRKPIEIERLKVRPESKFCLICKTKMK